MTTRDIGWEVFGWGSALALAALGLRTLQPDVWHGGPLLLLASVLCLPPLRRKVNAKLGVQVHGILYAGAAVVLLFTGISLAADQQSKAKAKAELAEQLAMRQRVEDRKRAAEAEFRANKLTIVAEAQRLFEAGDFRGVRAAVARFAFIADPDVTRVLNAASLILLRQELDQNPTHERRAAIYSEIAKLDPSDADATAKSRELGSEIAEKRNRDARKQARAEEIRRQFSGWDGSHPAVEIAIKARLKNPGSYEHIKTSYLDLGSETFTVFTEFRGRNSFNAIVNNSATADVTPAGKVVSISIH